METMIKVYCLNKVLQFVKTSIYRSEIVNAGREGVEKFNAVVENLWKKAEEYVIKEKSIDRKWIPDVIENFGEEAIHEAIKVLREELNPEKLVQEIFNIEKTENPEVL